MYDHHFSSTIAHRCEAGLDAKLACAQQAGPNAQGVPQMGVMDASICEVERLADAVDTLASRLESIANRVFGTVPTRESRSAEVRQPADSKVQALYVRVEDIKYNLERANDALNRLELI